MNKLTATKLITTIVLPLALYTSSVQAERSRIDEVERAASNLDVPTLTELSTSLTGYDSALANYRLSVTANLLGKSDLADEAIDKAIKILEKIEQENEQDVEVKALLAQSYGYKIALSPIKGIIYGPKSQSKLEEALKLEPNNPRALLVQGIGAINTPPMFGGSSELAVESFSKAIQHFSDDQYSEHHWGYSEAYTWRGMIYSQQGKMELAQNDWHKALEIDPGYGWAKSLLSQIEE